jgi:flagellar hook-basal body complex protein FliE
MNIFGLGASGAAGASGLGSLVPGAAADANGTGAFEQLLGDLNEAASAADAAVGDVAVGGDADLHDVVLAVELESLAFDLAVQIRNRLVDAYQEVFRMQI